MKILPDVRKTRSGGAGFGALFGKPLFGKPLFGKPLPGKPLLGKTLPGILYVFAALIMAVFGSFSPANAQLSSEVWSEPVNLSQSGAASNPIMVVDSNGMYHVIWQDAFSGYVYTFGDGVEWSDPVPVRFPWSVRGEIDPESTANIPELYAGPDGLIHALWTNEENVLYYSRVTVRQFASSPSWMSRLRISDSVLDWDVARDASGRLHLVYLRSLETADSPAGIYYHTLNEKSNYWSLPQLLYQSPYFRSLTVENAHVQVDTASTSSGEQVFVVWDDPARERVFFTKSGDSGQTWNEPVEIDKPEEGTAMAGPSNIQVGANGDKVLLLWQSQNTETSCLQFYQSSLDGGGEWQERQQKPEGLLDCPDRNELMEMEDGSILLFSTVNEQVYLQNWDGAKWSDPQVQEILNSFTDPGTNRLVNLGCHKAALIEGGNLLVAGCDQGDGKDIWWLKRQLIDVADWFPKDVVWRPLVDMAAGSMDYLTPVVLAENSERMHAFWSQASENFPDGPGTAIFYSRWDGRQWSQPMPVISPQDGKAEQPDALFDSSGRLSLVWSGGQSGEVFFSQASSNQAMLATAWSKPLALPAPHPAGSSPDILMDPSGRIYVAYAIPLNEARGIYLTYSDDSGATWSDAVRIFDAASAGWEMVDHPHLALTANGNVHVLWTRYSLPSGVGPLGLYYARSADGGISWSEAAPVMDKPVIWSQLIGIGGETVHRIWQEQSSGRATLWHEASFNNGTSWTRTAPVSIFGETVGSPSVTWDQAGQLHLFQVVSRGASSYMLQHWRWDGMSWVTERTLDLEFTPNSRVGSLTSMASPDGELVAVISASSVNRANGQEQYRLYFAGRSYEMPEALPTPVLEATTAPEPTASPSPAPTEAQTARPTSTALAAADLSQAPPSTGNILVASVLVPVAAGLIVLVAILIGVRMRRY